MVDSCRELLRETTMLRSQATFLPLRLLSEISTYLEIKTETRKIQLIVKINFNCVYSEEEQEKILIRIREHSETITVRSEEYNELR